MQLIALQNGSGWMKNYFEYSKQKETMIKLADLFLSLLIMDGLFRKIQVVKSEIR